MSLEGSGSSPFADILPTIRCPRDCHLFEADLLEMTRCPFLHRLDVAYETAPKLPPFVCVNHLLASCTNLVTTIGELNKCRNGFHMTLEELVDLEHFNEKMAEVILNDQTAADSHSSRPAKRPRLSASENSQEESPDCGICLEPITGNFGLLASCTHPFCTECLLSWYRESSSMRNCPVCRQHSPFLLHWPTLVTSTEEKQQICQLQQQVARMTDILGVRNRPPLPNLMPFSLAEGPLARRPRGRPRVNRLPNDTPPQQAPPATEAISSSQPVAAASAAEPADAAEPANQDNQDNQDNSNNSNNIPIEPRFDWIVRMIDQVVNHPQAAVRVFTGPDGDQYQLSSVSFQLDQDADTSPPPPPSSPSTSPHPNGGTTPSTHPPSSSTIETNQESVEAVAAPAPPPLRRTSQRPRRSVARYSDN